MDLEGLDSIDGQKLPKLYGGNNYNRQSQKYLKNYRSNKNIQLYQNEVKNTIENHRR